MNREGTGTIRRFYSGQARRPKQPQKSQVAAASAPSLSTPRSHALALALARFRAALESAWTRHYR